MVYYSLFLKYAQCSVSEISINDSFLDHTHLGVFQEQEFLAVGVEGDFGLEVGPGAFLSDVIESGAVPVISRILPGPKRLCSIRWPVLKSVIGAGTKSASEIFGGRGRLRRASILEAVGLAAEVCLLSYLTLPEEP